MSIEFHDLDIAQRARVFFNMLLEGKCCSACLLGLHASLLLMQSCNVHGERKRTIARWRTSHPIFLCPLGDIASSFSLSFGGHHIQFFFVLWRTSHPIFLCPSFEGHRTRILCVLGDSMLFLIHSPLHVLVMLRLKFIFCSNVDAWKKTLSAGKTGPAPQKEAEKQHS